jgi:DNA polymerase III, delta subunit
MSARAPVVLLAGPGGRRLEALALEAAADVICGPGFDPESSAARRVFRREHPDLMIAAPERRRRVNPPPFEETDGKEMTLPTALVRAVAADATRLPYEAPRRAVVFLDVDRTEPAAFSALLKILEEPPSKTRFLLTATRPRLLPPTILSRVALRPVPGSTREETAAFLRSRGMGEEEAEARAAFSPHDADEAAELDVAEARATRDALLEAASGVFLSGALSWSLALGTLLGAGDGPEAVRRLQILAQLLRDAAAAPVDPAGRYVLFRERFADLARLGAAPAARLLDAASGSLALAASLTDSRRNVKLATEAFALGL